MSILQHVVLPVATENDAIQTCAALQPHLEDIESVVAVNVIEKSGGGIDKAPLAKRESDAEAMLDTVEQNLSDAVSVETKVAYGTDVVDTLFDVAESVDAVSMVFVARKGGRITRLLSGNTSIRLVTEGTIPVIALPRDD